MKYANAFQGIPYQRKGWGLFGSASIGSGSCLGSGKGIYGGLLSGIY